jgi:GAF domain-containing protein
MIKLQKELATVSAQRNALSDQNMEKQVLALAALSELTRQFASKPDFEELLNAILYTFSGQFGVGSCYVLIRDPQSIGDNPVFCGIGKFKDKFLLEFNAQAEFAPDLIFQNTQTRRVEMSDIDEKDPMTGKILQMGSLKVVVPLIHGGSHIGHIGLGDKLKVAEYSDSELELMTSIANAITPLLINSFLFKGIAALSNWYREIINNVKQGVFVFDGNRKLTHINQAGIEMMMRITESEFNKETISNQKLEKVFSE